MPAKKKILIVTTSVGGGHKATARALAATISRLYKEEVDVEVADVFKDLKFIVPLEKLAVPFYENSVKWLGSYPFRLSYFLSDTRFESLKKFIQLWAPAVRPTLESYLEAKNPDLIICTYMIVNHFLAQSLKKTGLKVPLVTMVTDSGKVHSAWLYAGEDAILAPTKETADLLVQAGLSARRVHYLGFPLDPRFRRLPTKSAARTKLGLANQPTVLINGGGLGLSTKMLALARLLATQELNAQYLFVAGYNRRLAAELRQIDFKTPTRVFGYVANMPDLLAASDFVVGKAGWISVYEAIVAKRPNLILDIVPGQEEPNAELVQLRHFGLIATTPRRAAQLVTQFLSQPQSLEPFNQALRASEFKADESDRIAKFLIETFIKS